MPSISVIVPVYKVEPYIHRCVDSILAQTFTDFELILVDDGSPDNCGKICEEYAAKDNRITVIHKENGGLSDARNAGINWAFAHSNSEWITFIDSDDWVHSKYLSALFHAVNNTGSCISICGYARTSGETPIVYDDLLEGEVVKTESFFCEHNINAVVAWGKLFRKDLFSRVRYPVRRFHEDEFTTHKVLFMCNYLLIVNQPLYFYYQNINGIIRTTVSPKRMIDRIDAHEDQLRFMFRFGYREALKVAVEKTVFGIAETLLRRSNEIPCLNRTRIRCDLKIIILRFHRACPYITSDWIIEAAFPVFYRIKNKIKCLLTK